MWICYIKFINLLNIFVKLSFSKPVRNKSPYAPSLTWLYSGKNFSIGVYWLSYLNDSWFSWTPLFWAYMDCPFCLFFQLSMWSFFDRVFWSLLALFPDQFCWNSSLLTRGTFREICFYCTSTHAIFPGCRYNASWACETFKEFKWQSLLILHRAEHVLFGQQWCHPRRIILTKLVDPGNLVLKRISMSTCLRPVIKV